MCGFVGYFGEKEKDLGKALQVIAHRGPDMSGICSGRDWGVGFARLSIIDLSPSGMQPFRYDDVVVYLNGEIYNYIELLEEHKDEFVPQSHSDVEIVPFLYRKYGIDFLHRLNGMFAIVIIDERTSEKFLVRDRFGKKPLFYSERKGTVVFASEIKSLGELFDLEVDGTHVAINLHNWLLMDPLTLYKGVWSVNPGAYVKVRGSKIDAETTWYCPSVEEVSSEKIRDEIGRLFSSSMQLRLRSDVPVGVFLSGGLDSMLIAAEALRRNSEVRAVTAKIVGKSSWENNTTDTLVPPRFCQENGMRHSEVTVDYDFWNRNVLKIVENYEEIFIDSGNLIFYALSAQAAADGVKVIYTGVGGDESFGGYPWQIRLGQVPSILRGGGGQSTLEKGIYGLANLLPQSRVSRRLKMWGTQYLNPQACHAASLGGGFFDMMRDVEGKVVREVSERAHEYFRKVDSLGIDDWMNRINYANIYNVIKNQNYKVDMGCMSASVENRSPFLDFRLFELMMGVSHQEKIKDGPKGILRAFAKTVLPEYVTSAPKSGPTMPLHIWFSEPKVREKVIGFIRKNSAYIGDVVSADLAGHVNKDSAFFEDKGGSMRMFALTSYLLWAHRYVGKRRTDTSMSFDDYAET